MDNYERLTEKAIGCFGFSLKDHKAIRGEFANYDAFFHYHIAVMRLGEYEDSGLSPEDLKERTCEWKENEDGDWSCSKCTAVWIFPGDGPGENDMSYCPECGRKIVKISPYQEEVEGDE